ncbi:MAG: CoA transferase [Rhizobacter sp.]|nr:CoA transferase [Rhizobacter sp.]
MQDQTDRAPRATIEGGVDEPAGPLAGIRVLDFTTVVLGPLATRILGDLGAEVIKVEGIEGDLMRANGVSRNPGMSSIFMAINRNKRSIAVDLKAPDGRQVFLDLAATCDVLVHNMRIPAIERLRLAYDDVKAVNPRIVYCAATGFGQNGPHRARPAFDDIIQAASGMAGLMGQLGERPEYVPTLVADKTAGMAVVNAVLAALFHRERSGRGQYVEVPMYETLVEFTLAEHMGGLAFEPTMGPAGYARITSGGRRPLATADGFLAMLPYGPSHYISLFERLGRADILARYDLSDRHRLNASVRDLYQELSLLLPERPTAEWIEICDALDIPCTPIWALDDLPEHPHLKAVGLFESIEHPSEGLIRSVRPAVLFADTPASVRLPAPLLGQHSANVLAELGYADADIERLSERGVIRAAGRPVP